MSELEDLRTVRCANPTCRTAIHFHGDFGDLTIDQMLERNGWRWIAGDGGYECERCLA